MRLRKIRALAVICLVAIFLGSVLQPFLLVAQEEKSRINLSSLQVNFGDLPTPVIPLERAIMHRFTVKNIGTSELWASLEFHEATTGTELGTFPQPSRVFLAPNEEQWVVVLMDPQDKGVGTHNFSANYTFRNDLDPAEYVTFVKNYTYSVLDEPNITGSFIVQGKVVDQNGQGIQNADVVLSAGDYNKMFRTGADGKFSFSVISHPNWWLSAFKKGYKEVYIFNLTNTTYYTLKLLPFLEEIPQYECIKLVTTDSGFWKYAVSADEQYILLCQGMKHWANSSLKNQSKLMLYTLDGNELWNYSMEWEAWGCDLSQDGKYAVYVTGTKRNPPVGEQPTEETKPGDIGVLDAQTGELLWKKNLSAANFPATIGGGIESNEVAFSCNNTYIGVGGVPGDFYLLNRATGDILWRSFTKGQVRKILFSKNDTFVYVGSGDGRLYKFVTTNGSLQWTAHIWSWPYTYGLALSPDESLISAGTKTGDVSVVRTSDGLRLWDYYMGISCVRWVQFSPDGSLLAAGSGAPGGTTIFNATTGEPLWRTGYSGAGMFTADGKNIFICEATGKLFTNDGTLITERIAPGIPLCYCKVAYISKDKSKIVLASMDMEPGKGGIAFFRNTNVSLEGGDWVKESGIRVANGVSSCTITLPNGTYRMYYTGDSAYSTDGLNFVKEAGIRIWAEAGGSDQERVANCAIIVFPNWSYRMIYEGVKGWPPSDVHKFFSAFSYDGLNFIKESGVRLESEGTSDYGQVSVPDIIKLQNGSYRMYYVGDFNHQGAIGNSIRSAISYDDGLTWIREGDRLGSSDTMGPDVIMLPNETFRMFYTAPSRGITGNPMCVYSAISYDCLNWVIEEGVRLSPGGQYDLMNCLDPDVVQLPNDSYRMYYSGMNAPEETNILSAISPKIEENRPPTVTLSSPPNGAVINTTSVILSWYGSDPDNDILTYDIYLDIIPTPTTIVSHNQRNTTYLALNLLNNTTYYWKVIPNDGFVNGSCVSGIWDFTIKIGILNQPPQITYYNPLTNPTINEGESITFNITAYDPDGIIPAVEWRADGKVVGNGSFYIFVANYTSAGIYIINVTVTDGQYYVYHEWVLTVADVNIITPAGGNISFENIKLDFPENATSENMKIIITPISVTPPAGYRIIGKVYDISTNVTITFLKPITITLSYNETDLPEGISERELAIYKKVGTSWVKLDSTVNKANCTVSTQATSLSDYAILYEIKKVEKPAEIPWTWIIGIIAIIVVIVIVGIVLRKRKRDE